MIELLSPVGDFECLKAAVQNGANAVYFGANLFSARAFAKNFDDKNLKEVIKYAKLRGVKTHLTLNTLIKEDELNEAFELAKSAYEYGIDAIIVQDLGLSNLLIKNFPDIEIHASTQMTVHNLEGVNKLKELGFKRVVLSRELSIPEIEYICKNSNIEIEIFAHGALCISYSGQCLMSSMIGGRSGNRGKCAQPCRLPYKLFDKNKKLLNKGYLLSPRDLCSLEYLPQIIKAGVSSLKIEGRMKTPEYVATVTKIYRKYIDLAEKYISGIISEYKVDEKDKKDLLQVFNRGGFSTGHLIENSKKDLIFTEKPNHIGLYLGKVKKYNPVKGLISLNPKTELSVGDSVSFENENSKYTVSEITKNNLSITIGRMKGNIHIGDSVYKMSDKQLSNLAIHSFDKEHIKNSLDCKLNIQNNKNISVSVYCKNFYTQLDYIYEYKPQKAKNSPIDEQNILNQFNKTLDTCFTFENIEINLEENLFIPISILNDIRRETISKIQNKILSSFERKSDVKLEYSKTNVTKNFNKPKISVLLNILNNNFDYSKLENIDNIYIPLKYFNDSQYRNSINILSNKFKLYIYMPTIIKQDYIKIVKSIVNTAVLTFNIKGFVISNLGQLDILPNNKKFELIGNYTLNLYNSFTAKKLNCLDINTVTISPELDKDAICNFCNFCNITKELIVYGNLPLMTINYCIDKNAHYLTDRIGLNFRILNDTMQSISTIYNSKITSITYSDFNVNSVRLDFLEENINEINTVISSVTLGKRIEGNNYTNGNLNRII